MPTKFDFLSPGIQLREIDESQLEPVQEHDGILLIGRARSQIHGETVILVLQIMLLMQPKHTWLQGLDLSST